LYILIFLVIDKYVVIQYVTQPCAHCR